MTSDNSKEDIFEDSLDVGNIAMTVLDETIMSSSLGGDRYITPEYLAPLPQVIFQLDFPDQTLHP